MAVGGLAATATAAPVSTTTTIMHKKKKAHRLRIHFQTSAASHAAVRTHQGSNRIRTSIYPGIQYYVLWRRQKKHADK